MASYQAKLTGELGVCVASAAGTVNLLEGLADACMDGAPVLALTGQVPIAKIGTRAKQYFNQQALISNFADFTEQANSAPACLRLLIRAMSRAILKQAVAHLAIPGDIWTQAIQAEPGSKPALVTATGGSGSILGDLKRAVELMQRARRPLVLVGARGGAAIREIRELVTAWGAAVVVAQDAKGVAPDTWPEVIGGVGEGWIPQAVPECDCILLIGSASFEEKFLPKVAVIQVEPLPWQIDETYLWDSLAGDVPQIIKALTQSLQGYRPDAVWPGRIALAKSQLTEMIAADAQNNSKPIHPARLMAALNRVVAKDAIITLDEGAFNHWFDRSFQAEEQRVLLSARWRSMGAGLPAAIAARLNYPERQVVALVGDGGFLMSLGELTTAVKYRLPLTVVVVSNQVYGLEADKTHNAGFKPLGLEVQAPDFIRYAQACGAKGFRVEEPALLEETLQQAQALSEPALVDVICADVRLPYMGG